MLFDMKDKECLQSPIATTLPLVPLVDKNELKDLSLYSSDWEYFLPYYILDRKRGHFWKVMVDINAVAKSIPNNKPRLVQFLQRRHNSRDPILLTLRRMVEERCSISVVSNIFDHLNEVASLGNNQQQVLIQQLQIQGGRGSSGGGGGLGGGPAIQPSSPNFFKPVSHSNNNSGGTPDLMSSPQFGLSVMPELGREYTGGSFNGNSNSGSGSPLRMSAGGNIPGSITSSSTSTSAPTSGTVTKMHRTKEGYIVIDQQDLYEHLFLPLEDEKEVESKYLIAILTEYIRSLNFHMIIVEDYLYMLLISLMVRNNQFYQLHQFLQYHVISDSLHVACQLLSLEPSYPPAAQLALDILKRLSSSKPVVADQIVEVLITRRQFLAAMRFIKAYPNAKYSVVRFLEGATSHMREEEEKKEGLENGAVVVLEKEKKALNLNRIKTDDRRMEGDDALFYNVYKFF